MLNTVKIIISKTMDEVLNDASLSYSLKDCYSKLYANGSLVKHCQDSLRKYYRQIQIDGIMKAEEIEKIKNRTCKPGWKGLRYVTSIFTHINPDYLTDEMAGMYLLNNVLSESDFEKLPDSYIENKLIKNAEVKTPVEVIKDLEKVENVVEKVKKIHNKVKK